MKNALKNAVERSCAVTFAKNPVTKSAHLAIKNVQSAVLIRNATILAGKNAFRAWNNVLNAAAVRSAQVEIAIINDCRFLAKLEEAVGTNVSWFSMIPIVRNFILLLPARGVIGRFRKCSMIRS